MYSDKFLIPEWRTAPKRAIREGVGEGLLKIGKDAKVVVLTADLAGSTKVDKFAEEYPDRFFEVGVAEQNMAGVAAGLAFEGLIPFMSSYAAFSPGRNWEQIRVSIALSRANVKIIGSHGGVATGVNGPSHQGTEDIALMRVLPNMTVLTPADATQAAAAIAAAYKHEGPVYIRTARPETPDFTKDLPFAIGQAQVLREGGHVTVCASGIQVWDCLVVAERLAKEGVECEVVNISTIKPLDQLTIIKSAKKTGRVVTVEDHQVAGGMGGAVAEVLVRELPVPMKLIGLPDRFGVSGPWEEGYKEVGLDKESLAKQIKNFAR